MHGKSDQAYNNNTWWINLLDIVNNAKITKDFCDVGMLHFLQISFTHSPLIRLRDETSTPSFEIMSCRRAGSPETYQVNVTSILP